MNMHEYLDNCNRRKSPRIAGEFRHSKIERRGDRTYTNIFHCSPLFYSCCDLYSINIIVSILHVSSRLKLVSRCFCAVAKCSCSWKVACGCGCDYIPQIFQRCGFGHKCIMIGAPYGEFGMSIKALLLSTTRTTSTINTGQCCRREKTHHNSRLEKMSIFEVIRGGRKRKPDGITYNSIGHWWAMTLSGL